MAHFQSISSEQWVSCKRSCCIRWLCFENFVAIHKGLWPPPPPINVLQLPVFKIMTPPPPPHHCSAIGQYSKDCDTQPHPPLFYNWPVFKGLWHAPPPPPPLLNSLFYSWHFLKDYPPPTPRLLISLFYNCQFSKNYRTHTLHITHVTVKQLPVFKKWPPPNFTGQ